MAVSQNVNNIDKYGRELVQHGSADFPIAIYNDNLGISTVEWHWHDELEYAVVTEGSTTLTTDSEKYFLAAGQGFFINSSTVHELVDNNSSGCRFHSFVFNPSLVFGSADSIFRTRYLYPLMRNKNFPSIIFRSEIPWHRQAMNLIERVWQLCQSGEKGFEFKVRNLLSDLVLLTWENMPEYISDTPAKDAVNNRRIKTMLRYIHSNYHRDISVDGLAEYASVSKSECLRCFKTAIDTTPMHYVRQYRLNRAASMLIKTDSTVADIAAQCGFSDSSYFVKAFHKEKGCTPVQYRKIHCPE